MCRNSIDLSHHIRQYTESNTGETLRDDGMRELIKLQPFIDDKLVVRTALGFNITEKGSFFRRQIAASFDAYIDTVNTDELNKIVKFSQAL